MQKPFYALHGHCRCKISTWLSNPWFWIIQLISSNIHFIQHVVELWQPSRLNLYANCTFAGIGGATAGNRERERERAWDRGGGGGKRRRKKKKCRTNPFFLTCLSCWKAVHYSHNGFHNDMWTRRTTGCESMWCTLYFVGFDPMALHNSEELNGKFMCIKIAHHFGSEMFSWPAANDGHQPLKILIIIASVESNAHMQARVNGFG